MSLLAAFAGLAIVLGTLWDAFETVVLPRRITRRFRLTRAWYRVTWHLWFWCARFFQPGNLREHYLALFGPLSLLLLLMLWTAALVLGYGLLLWAAHHQAPGQHDVWTYLYLSGTSFFTLGLGDVAPTTVAGRLITVVESGTGLGFFALVISYLPMLYQAFSSRETAISLMDARAGSPPSAAELLRRTDFTVASTGFTERLREWERWAADLLEMHLSYPVLAYFRSQHDRQSWVAMLTMILDVSALAMAMGSPATHQARFTFAMARHAAIDLVQVLHAQPAFDLPERFTREDQAALEEILRDTGIPGDPASAGSRRFHDLRLGYEPYVAALSRYLLMPLPPWRSHGEHDDWETSPWETTL